MAVNATVSLDPATSVEILGLFARIHSKGNTIVLVTHKRDIGEYPHRIITASDGKVSRDEVNIHQRA